jgi:hypothetical protein
MERFYIVLTIFIVLVIISKLLPTEKEHFEKVKIKLKQKLNNCSENSNEPEIIVPIYAPWKTYYPASSIYPYYPFYPYYWNNYYT